MKDMNVRAEKNEVEIRKELNTMMTNQREKAKGIINALNEKLAKQKENYEKLAQEKVATRTIVSIALHVRILVGVSTQTVCRITTEVF